MELKLRKTDETLWDAFKMVDAIVSGTTDAAYLVVGASAKAWEARGRCSELFASASPTSHVTETLLGANAMPWLWLLQGGSARPTSFPSKITTQLVALAPSRIDATAGSVRCIRVQPDGTDRVLLDPLTNGGDWPSGVDPPPEYFEWKRKQRSFLQALERAGTAVSGDAAAQLAREAGGFNLDTECGLSYGWEPMILNETGTVRLTDAGRRFLRDWA